MKIYLGPAVGRFYEPDYIQCVLALLKRQPPAIVWAPKCNDALVSRSRSISAALFLKRDDCDVWLSIDTDIAFAPNDAIKLCEQALSRGAVVVGLYKTRSDGHGAKPASILPRGAVADSTSNELLSIKLGSTGFMAVPRVVFERLAETLPLCHPGEEWAFWPFFMPMVGESDDGEPIYLSEDYAFCQRVLDAGFEIFADPSVRLGHIGPYCYRFADGAYRIERLDEPGVRYRLDVPEPALALAGGSSRPNLQGGLNGTK